MWQDSNTLQIIWVEWDQETWAILFSLKLQMAKVLTKKTWGKGPNRIKEKGYYYQVAGVKVTFFQFTKH